MTMLYKLGISIAIIVIAALSGFFYGRVYEREAALKQAVQAYSQASEIQNEVNSYSDYALCLAIGGLREQCQVFMRGLEQTTKDK